MKKHNTARVMRHWPRITGDKTTVPQQLAHRLAHDKTHQFFSNRLLGKVLGLIPWKEAK